MVLIIICEIGGKFRVGNSTSFEEVNIESTNKNLSRLVLVLDAYICAFARAQTESLGLR